MSMTLPRLSVKEEREHVETDGAFSGFISKDANNHSFAHHVGIRVEDILLSSFTDPQPNLSNEKISPIVNYGRFLFLLFRATHTSQSPSFDADQRIL